MSGRGRGYCAGYDRPGFMNDGRGYGRGIRGRRFDRGGCWGYGEPFYDYAEPRDVMPLKERLELRKQALETKLESVKIQIAELEKSEEK